MWSSKMIDPTSDSDFSFCMMNLGGKKCNWIDIFKESYRENTLSSRDNDIFYSSPVKCISHKVKVTKDGDELGIDVPA